MQKDWHKNDTATFAGRSVDLIALLENATAANRDLDIAIWTWLADPQKYRLASHWPRYSPWESEHRGLWEPFYPALNAKEYTRSLDAALTLVPEGWESILYTETRCAELYPVANVKRPAGIRARANGATLATALCIAALKASNS